MSSFIIARFEAPLMAFGREAIDANGNTREFPDCSMVTGLLANALGYTRGETEKHQRLQERLVFGLRIDRLGHHLLDFLTAQIRKSDQGWTTHGVPEGRAGGPNTYDSPHIRFRHYRADACLTIALRLEPQDEQPTLGELAIALRYPARPLFIGRKCCLPAGPLLLGIIEAENLVGALRHPPSAGLSFELENDFELVLPLPEVIGLQPQFEIFRATTRRDWIVGVHTGQEPIARGRLKE